MVRPSAVMAPSCVSPTHSPGTMKVWRVEPVTGSISATLFSVWQTAITVYACATAGAGARAAAASAAAVNVFNMASPAFRPQHALVVFGDRSDTLIGEALHTRSGIGLGRVQVALRVGREVVDAEELARLAAAVAERGQHFERAAQQDVDLLVDAVGGVDVGLLRIPREGTVPHRSGPIGVRVDDDLPDERAVLLEDLDTVVHPIADVDEPVVRDDRAVHRVEL